MSVISVANGWQNILAEAIAGAGVLPEGYDDPLAMKDELLKMWSRGKADMRDVQEYCRCRGRP